MHIESTRLWKFGSSNAKNDLKKKLCKGCTGKDRGDDGKIKEAMAVDKDKNDDEK